MEEAKVQEVLEEEASCDQTGAPPALVESFLRLHYERMLWFSIDLASRYRLSTEDAEDVLQGVGQLLHQEPRLGPENVEQFFRQRIKYGLKDLRRRESRRAKLTDLWRVDLLGNQPDKPEMVKVTQSLRSAEEGLNPEDRDNVDFAVHTNPGALDARKIINSFAPFLRGENDRLTLHALYLHACGHTWSEVKRLIGWSGHVGTLTKRAHDLKNRLNKEVGHLVSNRRGQ